VGGELPANSAMRDKAPVDAMMRLKSESADEAGNKFPPPEGHERLRARGSRVRGVKRVDSKRHPTQRRSSTAYTIPRELPYTIGPIREPKEVRAVDG